jgi:hypothetical protein
MSNGDRSPAKPKRVAPTSRRTKSAESVVGVRKTPPSAVAKAPKISISTEINTIFQKDKTVREAISSNLRDRSAGANALRERAQRVFSSFTPSRVSSDGRARPTYLAPGDDLAKSQKMLINEGIDSRRASSVTHSMRIIESDELGKFIKRTGSKRTISLPDLMSYMNLKLQGRSFVVPEVDRLLATCKAEIEVERRVKQILASNSVPSEGNPQSTPADTPSQDDDPTPTDPDAAHLTATKLVKEQVDLQMDKATSPESQLRYSIPDRSDQLDKLHSNIQSFELRSGPSDVTSYHDFQNLQIAFENIWTELFDDKLTSLGQQLYAEYVRVKQFTGLDDGVDPIIRTKDDLKQLMGEIKDFSKLTELLIPPEVRPKAGGTVGEQVVTQVENAAQDLVDTYAHLFGFV